MPVIVEIILSGFVATLIMSGFFGLLRTLGTGVPSLIEVVGTLFTPESGQSRRPATLLHFGLGIAWAFIYYMFVRLYGSDDPAVVIVMCLGISFFHGLIVAFNLGNMVAEHPTHEEFRMLSPAVALTYLVTHGVYGAVLGTLFAILHVAQA